MFDIIEAERGIWVLTEDGESVLLSDCQKFGISRKQKLGLFVILEAVAMSLSKGLSLQPLIDEDLVKPLRRDDEAREENLWEARNKGEGGRLVFVMCSPNSIVVSAGDKGKISLTQTIRRGLKRWKTFLREEKKLVLHKL